jgi:hypothetical protein
MTTPVIPASSPTNVPAQGAMTYGNWWISQFMVQAQNPNNPVRVTAILRKYGTLPDGSLEFSPTDAPVTLTIPDLFAAAATNTDMASAIDALIAQVQALGTSQNVL